ncbi:Aste57867_19840 [Aphanomyces stellatus]|uniref:Aste57867_19840 protein n=1 Tax=Aphanomyces stellatus TaxID=120398 RepID=A0A485LE86_9STRA|nr:hypothetical protein As57867_019775 [Aphanomyces stellatus]VFT96538.1 Aste57867_19840 [Aphanomyces stellatus]
MDAAPTKETIQEAFHGASTRRTYSTYQRQFLEYFENANNGKDPCTATTGDCSEFLHHLYSIGRKARTIDCAKTAMVAFFKERHVEPNPAQATETKRYVVGLQKFNRQNNVDDGKKAHPLSVHELSVLMNSFGNLNPFVGAMFRFLFSTCYLGCFRISEVLALRWCDLARAQSEDGEHVSVRLRWHKKASVEEDCQIYNLVDEMAYPCLRVCGFYQDYLAMVKTTMMNVSDNAMVFPQVTRLHNGTIKVTWEKSMEQNYLLCIIIPNEVSFAKRRTNGTWWSSKVDAYIKMAHLSADEDIGITWSADCPRTLVKDVVVRSKAWAVGIVPGMVLQGVKLVDDKAYEPVNPEWIPTLSSHGTFPRVLFMKFSYKHCNGDDKAMSLRIRSRAQSNAVKARKRVGEGVGRLELLEEVHSAVARQYWIMRSKKELVAPVVRFSRPPANNDTNTSGSCAESTMKTAVATKTMKAAAMTMRA